MSNKPKYQCFELRNELPEHENLTDEEIAYARHYLNRFVFKKSKLIEVPFIILHPHTLSNMVIDIIRDYETFNKR